MNQVKGETLAELEDAIIQVLKNARARGDAEMRPSDIGRAIGTYRRDPPLPGDSHGRVHHRLLRKLEKAGRVEPVWNEARTKRRWRLIDTE